MTRTEPRRECLNCGTPVHNVTHPCENCSRNYQQTLRYIAHHYQTIQWLENVGHKLSTPERVGHTQAGASIPVNLTATDIIAQIDQLVLETIEANTYVKNGVLTSLDYLNWLSHTPVTWASLHLLKKWNTIAHTIKHIVTVDVTTYPCLNPDCSNRIPLDQSREEIECNTCHSIWKTAALTDNIHQKFAQTKATMTSEQASKALATIGITVPASTIRNWAAEGHIPTTQGGYPLQNIYRIALERTR